jgi:hypothetical protein
MTAPPEKKEAAPCGTASSGERLDLSTALAELQACIMLCRRLARAGGARRETHPALWAAVSREGADL